MTPIRRLDSPPPWLDPPAPPDPGDPPWVVGTRRRYAVGDAWYAVLGTGRWMMFGSGPDDHPLTIAPEHAGVVPIVVVLPPDGPAGRGMLWCVHAPVLREGGWGPRGWTVIGDLGDATRAPSLTVMPSIDMRCGWHGFLRAGRLETC